jgi:hypothetical protein
LRGFLVTTLHWEKNSEKMSVIKKSTIMQDAVLSKWRGINRKQSTRWQHLSRLKASALFSLQKIFSCYKTQQLILGTGIAIWWLTEPHLIEIDPQDINSYLAKLCLHWYIGKQ